MESPSSTLADRSPVVIRLQAVLGTLNNFVIANGREAGLGNFGIIMQSLTEELIEELDDKDEATVTVFMERMGEIIAWIGHGDNERLPAELQELAQSIQPSPAEVT
jgi:hypothetical protein